MVDSDTIPCALIVIARISSFYAAMDNATYDELNLPPVSNDETYSQLRRTHNEVRPSDERQRRADINQNTKEMKQASTKEAPRNTKVITAVFITMILVVLLILTILSIILS
ncbi:MAG: hypothetical protein MJE68_08460, partial [Proteobacteria bacterium]|nr:hypothetical protein [Pseudomonadota bacterium]